MVTEEGSCKPISIILLYLHFFDEYCDSLVDVFDNNFCIMSLLPLYYKTQVMCLYMVYAEYVSFFLELDSIGSSISFGPSFGLLAIVAPW